MADHPINQHHLNNVFGLNGPYCSAHLKRLFKKMPTADFFKILHFGYLQGFGDNSDESYQEGYGKGYIHGYKKALDVVN